MKIFILITTFFYFLYADKTVDFDYELDPYYSNVSMFVKFPDQNITDASDYSELELYTELATKTLMPNIFLIELAAHPMPIAGLVYRSSNEEQYTEDKRQNFNIVKTFTAGFEEPYSISFFVGRMMICSKDKDDHIGKNRAYMGYLLTLGDHSIKDNRQHYNRWTNVEVKLKGTRELDHNDLDWSFRIGARFNENTNFTDSYYMGLRRNRIDFDKEFLSWFYNSAFDFMTSFNADNLEMMETKIIVEKSWPASADKHISFGLGIGYIYTSGQKYNGALLEEGINNHQLVFRPNMKF
ncbi:hypothetical protein KKA17_08240 [bacterium]|nr:hypothetical protein [bacterium]MBU1884617.1 hypothetical protein [bacterium]